MSEVCIPTEDRGNEGKCHTEQRSGAVQAAPRLPLPGQRARPRQTSFPRSRVGMHTAFQLGVRYGFPRRIVGTRTSWERGIHFDERPRDE